MKFVVFPDDETDLRKLPSGDAEVVDVPSPNQPLGEGTLSPDGLWVHVKYKQGGKDFEGWVLKAHTRIDSGATLDREGFVLQCVIDEQRINSFPSREDVPPTIAPWFVLADFLIARAIIETGVKNAGALTVGSDGVGPLQVSTAEWQDFLTNAGPLTQGYDTEGRLHSTRQIMGAAWRMHSDGEKMNKLRIAANKATAKDPFVPSYLDLFFAYLTNSPAAALAILDAQTTPPQTIGIDQVLTKPTGPFEKTEVDALLTAREKYFGKPTAPMLLKDVLAGAETLLNSALKDAFNDIKNFMPEAIPVAATGGAPWLTVAQKDEEKKISENVDTDKDTIRDYFKATDFGRPSSADPIPAWCGAFVSHCMKDSGSATAAASIPKGAAAAASWNGWGSRLSIQAGDKIPEGAVVVLSKSPTVKGTGHVGFFVKFSDDKKRVFLLGGNQGDKVCTTDFDANRIAYVGWLDLAPAQTASGFNLAGLGIKSENTQFASLIVNKFCDAGYGKLQQIAALANAIGESKLNPAEHNTNGENSVGLFQLFIGKGVGGTHSVDELKNPEFNIQLIIAEAKKYPAFAKADTLAKAVDVFVRSVERPKDKDGQSKERLVIANKLLA